VPKRKGEGAEASAERDLLRAAFERADVGLCLVGPGNRVAMANAAWLRASGLRAEETIGHDILDLFPETRESAAPLYARARAGESVSALRHRRRWQGREVWWDSGITPLPMAGGTGLLITTREASGEVQARHELERLLGDSREANKQAITAGVQLQELLSRTRGRGFRQRRCRACSNATTARRRRAAAATASASASTSPACSWRPTTVESGWTVKWARAALSPSPSPSRRSAQSSRIGPREQASCSLCLCMPESKLPGDDLHTYIQRPHGVG